MKIKIFRGENLEALENDVNEFIKDKAVIDIKTNTVNYASAFRNGTPCRYDTLTTITVAYSLDPV